ncbi:hypothetical protein ACOSP6_01850 [Tenacibaculum sp. MEBiC06402]|uniref:hypothetical protein n=1 Tax=unclassified Tenacibaculum TaxID=2635139 RepID=UPI003B9A7505
MKNTSIFNQFDMVVSMTEKTINDQLVHLLRDGTIHSSFILVQEVQNNNYVYEVVNDASKIKPNCAYINANIMPQVDISTSGLNITFKLNMVSGKAAFWEGNGPLAHLKEYDINDWCYGIDVDMDLYKIAQDDIGKKIKVPDLVKNQLENFTDNMFSVNSLLMDFESTDLLKFNPTHTNAGDSGDVGIQQMVLFMQFYLKWLIKSGNPYILGYSINQTNLSKVPQEDEVPAELKPVGTTYSMYEDPVNSDKSNLNFVLATKGGFGHISGSPGTFDTNWIGATEDINAKMIVSHADLVEALILKPLYNNLQKNVFEQIHGHINVGSGNSYDKAKSLSGSGIHLNMSNVNAGTDQYVNTLDVSFDNKTSSVDINIKGKIKLYKEVSKKMLTCTAKAHAGGTINWSGKITIESTKDANGNPTLKISQSTNLDNVQHDSSKNDCAKTYEIIGKIIGTILDALTLGLDQGFFTKLFDDLMDLKIPNIGNIGQAFSNLSNSVRSTVLLPAGQVFYFKNPSIDNEGNFYLQLTYKSEH